MNKTTLIGRLTSDPKEPKKENAPFRFTLAVALYNSKRVKNPKTSFIPCSAWGAIGHEINKRFKKGDPIVVSGYIDSRMVGRYFQFSVVVKEFDLPITVLKERVIYEEEEWQDLDEHLDGVSPEDEGDWQPTSDVHDEKIDELFEEEEE